MHAEPRSRGARSGRRAAIRAAGLWLAAIAAAPVAAQVQLQPRPDLCAPTQIAPGIEIIYVDGVGAALRIFLTPQTAPPTEPGQRWDPKVALIVNGNSYHAGNYGKLATFLAGQGFISVVAQRSSDGDVDPQFVVDALDATFAELDLNPTTPVALIGHSRGGGMVAHAALLNAGLGSPYAIKALVGLAPNVDGIAQLTPDAVSDYLLIYGSQDEDMTGTEGAPHEAFAAYDRAGTESSTTCTAAVCVALPGAPDPMERTMIYIHGADHPGLIGKETSFTGVEQEFVHYDDQYCIARSYTAGFLRWKMMGDTVFKGMLRDHWRAATVNAMTSSVPDYLGNPAGSPLRMQFQVSPRQRRTVEDFQDGAYSLVVASPALVLQVLQEGASATNPHYIRHETRSLSMSWPQQQAQQTLGLNVPASSRDTTAFNYVAVRVGQLYKAAAAYRNTSNVDLSMMIGLYDGVRTKWEALDDWGSIARSDVRPGGNSAHSAMSTIAIPLGAFGGLDRDNVSRVYFRTAPNSRGSVLIDSIEWWKD